MVASKTRVRPRDAASVILHRQRAGATQVLLGRRHKKSAFMPDVYVFPGGRVDPADARIKPATPLDQCLVHPMAVGDKLSRAMTIANAAVRETFEECGVLIAHPGQIGGVKQATWLKFRELGIAPHLACLRYVGRAITPASQPIRFHARFFSCNVDELVSGVKSPTQRHDSSTVVGGDGELEHLHWVNIDATEALPMRGITRFMLQEHQRLLQLSGATYMGDAVYLHRKDQLTIVRSTPVIDDSAR